jgi:hypothetical protein
LDGATIAGPPERIAEELREYEEPGCEHFVFDLRARLAECDQLVPFIAEQVLPLLR